MVFSFNNPQDSRVSGRIFDLRGRFVASLPAGPLGAQSSLVWNGKADGAVVPSGVYLYQIQGEDKTFSGTVVVAR